MGRDNEPGRKEAKIVFTRSGDWCAMPDCGRPLVLDKTDRGDPAALVGKLAHIAGLNPGSARYDAEMSEEERNSVDNLMAVCPSCHDKIDAQPLEYTREKLRKVKIDHEMWVSTTLKKSMNELTFPELYEVISRMIAMGVQLDGSHAIDPALALRNKIARNGLSTWTDDMIRMGLVRVELVKNCINASDDATLAGRLKNGMVREYERLKGKGLDGDGIFFAMWDLARGGSGDVKRAAAGLAVLVYFFEACEVFES